jgi:hypothetical protein
MSATHTDTGEYGKPETYAVRIKGHLDHRWAAWFEGLTIRQEANGVTLLTGPLLDQAALHGLLRKVRDLGLPLLSITQAEPKPAGGADAPDTRDTLDAQP